VNDRPPPPELVAALPRYQIGTQLGEGGVGVVYAGWDPALERRVAVKHLPGRLAEHSSTRLRFRDEGQALAKLDHPHIVRVFESTDEAVTVPGSTQPHRVCALVLEHLPGGTLRERFRRQGLSMEQSCAAVLAMLSGLQAAHDAGILHRDVKLGNAMFDGRGSVKVTDFGLARIVGGETTLVSRDGRIVAGGTPGYMAPEQVYGGGLDERTDVYSSAVALYYLLTGRLPVAAGSDVATYRQNLTTGTTAPPGPTVPARLAAALAHGLARDPEQRPASAGAFAAEIATAATWAFGAGWLDRAGIPVLDLSPAVREALTPPSRSWVRAEAGSVHVQPTVLAEVAQPQIDDAAPLVRIEDLGTGLPPPRLPAALAAIAAILLAVAAVVWPAARPAAGDAGLQIVDGGPPVRFDLSEPVTVTGTAATPETFRVRLSLSAAGIPLDSSTSGPKTVTAGQRWSAAVPATTLGRWVAGGAVRGRVELLSAADDRVIRKREVTVQPTQPPIASAMGAGALLVTLLALANLEGTRRAVREGRRWTAAPVIAGIWGLPLGLGVWMSLAALTRREPTLAGGVVCALLGAIVGVAATVAVRRQVARTGPLA
jgi:serine/threonine-protein kinase